MHRAAILVLLVAACPDASPALEAKKTNILTDEPLSAPVKHALADSSDGRQFLSGSRDGTLRLWDLAEKKELRRFHLDRGWINWVTFLPDDKHALVAGETVSLWNLETGHEVRQYKGHTYGINQVILSADGKYVLTASYDWSVRLFDAQTGKVLRILPDHLEYVWTVAFTPDGRFFLSGGGGLHQDGSYIPGQDHAIRLWEVNRVLSHPASVSP